MRTNPFAATALIMTLVSCGGTAIRAFTLTPACASFQEDITGSITPGKLAGMVVLSEDMFRIPLQDIEEVGVRYTLVDGRIDCK